jgi:hypothetical protein
LAGVEELASLSLEFYALAARRAEMRHFLRDYFQQYRALLAILLQEGVDAGEFVAMEADTAATTLIAQFEGIVLLWSVDPERVDLAQQSQTAVQLLLQGLLIRPATTGEAA